MEWIPVDEKAPEIGQRIICGGLQGAIFIGYYCGIEDGPFERKKHVVALSINSKDRREFEAWMLAPKPYTNIKKRKEFLAIRAKYIAAHQYKRRR